MLSSRQADQDVVGAMLDVIQQVETLVEHESRKNVARYADREDDQKLGKKLVMSAWCLFGNGGDT
jgi:hypothetical protein